MSKRRTGDAKLMQEINRSIIFEYIRKYGPISRIEIAKANHLSPTTVTSAVNELIKKGLVHEGKTGASNGGRKPILLQFSPNNSFIVGVSITNTTISIAKLNLEAKILHKHSFSVEGIIGEALIQHLLEKLEFFLQNLNDIKKCIGISIVTPGVVDYNSGIIRYNSAFNLHDVPLRDLVEERFQIKTFMGNDTTSIALAEKEMGAYGGVDNLIYIMVDDGVGAGIVIDGTIFRGSQGGAAEFGHMIVEREGLYCNCGNKGCLGNYVGWPSIQSRIISALKQRVITVIAEKIEGDLNKITPAIFLKAVDEGDKLANDILEDVASFLSTGITNVVNLFNPEVIIIGGEIGQNETLISKVSQTVFSQGLNVNIKHLKIYPSSLGNQFMLSAAANLVLHEMFQVSY